MTGQGFERMRCAVHPMPSVPATGVTAPLPPHSQEAERRTESRARHTGSRWGLRVLVVGGLAGAAWLLTGIAAQAADQATKPPGSVVDSVATDAGPPIDDLLQAADQPLEDDRPVFRKHRVAHHEQHPRHHRHQHDVVIVAGAHRLTGGPDHDVRELDPAADAAAATAPAVEAVERSREHGRAHAAACCRLPIAVDGEIRRYGAEAPTVSPD